MSHKDQSSPFNQSIVRFGYSWTIVRVLDSVREAGSGDKQIDFYVLLLKQLAMPFFGRYPEFKEAYERISQDPDYGVKLERRMDQLGVLVQMFYKAGVLVDHGVPGAELAILQS